MRRSVCRTPTARSSHLCPILKTITYDANDKIILAQEANRTEVEIEKKKCNKIFFYITEFNTYN